MLYESYIKDLPAVDLRTALSPGILSRRTAFSNISELWFCEGSYRQKMFTLAGCEEKYTLGKASDYEKFKEFCRILPSFIGNPIYTASHFELIFFFGCDLVISDRTCDEIWELTSERLFREPLTFEDIARKARIKKLFFEVSAEDAPRICENKEIPGYALPLFSPDKELDITKPGSKKRLIKAGISDIKDFAKLLFQSMDMLERKGCRTAFHRIDSAFFAFAPPSEYKAELVLKKVLTEGAGCLTKEEFSLFKTEMIYILAKEYKRRGWVLQLTFDSAFDAYLLTDYLTEKEVFPRALISAGHDMFVPRPESCRTVSHGFENAILSDEYEICVCAQNYPLGSLTPPPSEADSPLALCHHDLFRRRLANTVTDFTHGLTEEQISHILGSVALSNAEKFI